ncbi:MAG: monovalent cation/H+ antiporter subunit D [Geminicoccaceae bacterium]|nr:monovalent cation/H+ antiporter subunit D [Geminicoccaceae bacterium]MDW8123617.1 monovalent cation/H+ antiporter subunit D [Geminicoccaceae bacterium]MDW8339958.1 monovalent cation/H+ antiporter subunit D [Geminicoccaceae bacterium]
MTDWIIVPVVLPAAMAASIVLVARFDLALQRTLSLATTVFLLGVAVGLFLLARDGVPRPYLLGAWPAPFGIVLVLDRLSALMLVLTQLLALLVLLYAAAGWDRQGRHFHALFQFQLMGLNGAFLTGDVFNLFVFFEVLLIASYGLFLHGAGVRRLVGGFKYVTINLLASTLFLFAVGTIYAVTGTLNMADLALKAARVGPEQAGLLRTGVALLLVVFAVKAALAPLHLWLPGTYGVAAPPVAALFAVMTKVGAYAILRVHLAVFGGAGSPAIGLVEPWVVPAALATLVLGTLGVLGARSLQRLAAYSVLASMGTLALVLAVPTSAATAAALYYLVHSTLAAAGLFLVGELVAERRGAMRDELVPAPPFPQLELLAAGFLLAALATAGLPPLSGFLGKIWILDALRGRSAWPWLWAAVLVTSLLTVLALARAGSLLFWKPAALAAPAADPPPPRPRPLVPLVATATLLALPVLLAGFAGPLAQELEATARQLYARQSYVEAVLGPSSPPAPLER